MSVLDEAAGGAVQSILIQDPGGGCVAAVRIATR